MFSFLNIWKWVISYCSQEYFWHHFQHRSTKLYSKTENLILIKTKRSRSITLFFQPMSCHLVTMSRFLSCSDLFNENTLATFQRFYLAGKKGRPKMASHRHTYFLYSIYLSLSLSISILCNESYLLYLPKCSGNWTFWLKMLDCISKTNFCTNHRLKVYAYGV